ncbi:unnamed protein product [Dicrocoelium dendriticum]|nr:unnamed protein product [Dicrocoelium dendriticum]
MPPSSVHSLKSQGSSLQSNRSNCSRKSKGYSYRTIGRQSVVDENLFGDPNRLKEKQKNTNNINSKEEAQINVFRPGISETNCEKERIFRGTRRIKHVASDLIRELIIPEEEPNTKSIILTQDKYNELKEKAHVINDDDERTAIQKAKAAKEAEAAASLARKEEMRKHDLARTKNTKLTDLEEEARKQADVLLQKALEQRQDQEDEIRELNELIRNAKIQAIRDEQILEKQQIRKELSEEELRLDNMMELARQNAIRIQEEIDKKRKEQVG